MRGRDLLAYAPAVTWAAFLFMLGGATELPPVPPVPHIDKVAHFGAYGVLGALLGWGWRIAGRRPAWPWLILAALLLGAVDELRHLYIPEREAELGDWIADALGAATGFFIAVRLLRRRNAARAPSLPNGAHSPE